MGTQRRTLIGALIALLLMASACTTSGGEGASDAPPTTPAATADDAEPDAEATADDGVADDVATDDSVGEASDGGATALPLVLEDPVNPPGYYVSPNGDDGAAGTSPDQAFATIARGVKDLQPGDTLWVLDGEYVENERTDSGIIVTNSGTEDAWIRIAAFPGANPVIRTDHKNGMKIDGASYVEVRGLTFVGSIDQNLLAGGRYSGAGINVDGIFNGGIQNHHVRVIGNTISGYGAGGIPVTGTSHVEIRDNTIFDVATVDPDQHSGISIFEPADQGFGDDADGYSNYITGNTVYRVENTVPDPRLGRITDGNCIIMDLTLETNYTGRTLISNNLCLDNGGRGVQIYRSGRVDVVNNTLFANSQSSEIAAQGGDLGAFESLDVTFANNLVFTIGEHVPARASQSDQIQFFNNIYVAGREAQYGGHGADGDQWISDLAASILTQPGTTPDPALFLPVDGSLAIDAGTDLFTDVVGRDFVGRERTTPDIGAFEIAS